MNDACDPSEEFSEAIVESWSLSFVPFDLGAPLLTRSAVGYVASRFADTGWEQWQAPKVMDAYAPDSVLKLEKNGRRLVVGRHGICVLIVRTETERYVEDRRFSAVVHCAHRQARHNRIIKGMGGDRAGSTVAQEFQDLVRDIRRGLATWAVSSIPGRPPTISAHTSKRSRRPTGDKVFEYVLSMSFLRTAEPFRGDPGAELVRTLGICLNPALVRLEDVQTSSRQLDGHSFRELHEQLDGLVRIGDVDLESAESTELSLHTGCYAAWSGVVVVGQISEDEEGFLAAVQVRVQSSWFASWVVRDTVNRTLAGETGRRPARDLKWQAAHLTRLGHQVRQRPDASESGSQLETRLAIEQTSGVAEEWATADVSLADAQENARLHFEDREFRRATVLEAFLMLISIASLAQIVLPLPILSWSDAMEHPTTIVVLLAMSVGGLALITLRRRT